MFYSQVCVNRAAARISFPPHAPAHVCKLHSPATRSPILTPPHARPPQLVLAKKGPLGKIWLAAHMDKKVPKLQIIQTNIPAAVENVMQPNVPMALRVSGHLLLGVVRVFSRKVTYLLTDCSDALIKIKDAFAKGQGGVELAPGAGTKNFEDITRQQEFDDEMDLDADLAQQAMLFATDEDDALAGIAIPDAPEDLFAADGFNVDEGTPRGSSLPLHHVSPPPPLSPHALTSHPSSRLTHTLHPSSPHPQPRALAPTRTLRSSSSRTMAPASRSSARAATPTRTAARRSGGSLARRRTPPLARRMARTS